MLNSLAPAEWYDRYSRRFEDTRLPRTASHREVLAQIIGADGFYLLDNIYSQTFPKELRQLPAVEVLRQVWLQQYYAPTDKIQLRNEKDGPPSALRIRSPYDLDARNSTKRTTNWTGYKVHLTESCDQDSPHIITHVETGASQLCKNKGTTIIRETASRIMGRIQSCGFSSSCSAPEVISSKQSSRERMSLCISSITERLKTDITASIWLKG